MDRPLPHAGEFADMRGDMFRLGNIGHGVLQRITGQKHLLFRQPDDVAVRAVDVEVVEFDAALADLKCETSFEQPVGHDDGADLRIARFKFLPVPRKRIRGQLQGDDLAIGKDLVSGDMIRMPVTEHDPDRGDAEAFEMRADRPRMR